MLLERHSHLLGGIITMLLLVSRILDYGRPKGYAAKCMNTTAAGGAGWMDDAFGGDSQGAHKVESHPDGWLSTLRSPQLARRAICFLSSYTWGELFLTYLILQLIFLNLLLLVENIRDLIFRAPRVLKLGNSYLTAKPTRVDRKTALSYDTPWCLYERLKMVFFVFTGLIVLRLLILVVFATTSLAMMSVCGLGGRNRYDNPVWFRVFSTLAYTAFCIASTGVGFYNFKVFGRFASREECKVLIGNHSCIYEVCLLFALTDYPAFVTRKGNKLPFFTSVERVSEAIQVDREAVESRRRAAEALRARAKNKNPNAPQLIVFPEGTTANQRALFMFRKGAMEPGEPLQMICVSFPYKYFNPCWNGRCCGGNNFFELLFRLCIQFVNRVEVRALPVYTPTEEERNDPTIYANHCQEMMANVLRCGISNCTYADYVALQKGSQDPLSEGVAPS
uniref:WGS project CAEQ00000000 data, annotated contig 1735 n=1 Tax=Trypanosoma congolense (strain IL3000) TaxID=1068625 RepID=F9W8G9_TRYCI|nr:unnamed protein product [Trypanosoma congolense IL3000]